MAVALPYDCHLRLGISNPSARGDGRDVASGGEAAFPVAISTSSWSCTTSQGHGRVAPLQSRLRASSWGMNAGVSPRVVAAATCQVCCSHRSRQCEPASEWSAASSAYLGEEDGLSSLRKRRGGGGEGGRRRVGGGAAVLDEGNFIRHVDWRKDRFSPSRRALRLVVAMLVSRRLSAAGMGGDQIGGCRKLGRGLGDGGGVLGKGRRMVRTAIDGNAGVDGPDPGRATERIGTQSEVAVSDGGATAAAGAKDGVGVSDGPKVGDLLPRSPISQSAHSTPGPGPQFDGPGTGTPVPVSAASAAVAPAAAYRLPDRPINPRLRALEESVEKTIFDFRFFTLLGVLGSLTGSVLCFAKGCYFVVQGFKEYYTTCLSGIHTGKVILLLVEAVDVFLVGTVMLIFGMGLYELFITNVPSAVPSNMDRALNTSTLFGMFRLRERPRWMKIQSLDELKTKLGHVIVMILLVNMFEKAKMVEVVTAKDLVFFSLSVLMSAGSLYLLNRLHQ